MKGANPSTPTDYFMSFPCQGQVIPQPLWTFLLATLPLESPFCSGMSCAEIGFIFQKFSESRVDFKVQHLCGATSLKLKPIQGHSSQHFTPLGSVPD